jgi:hypothetical protein
MSEETILKNTFFGGYKKSDVIQYVDELLEENEGKRKQMEEQISFLVKENNRLKAKKQEGSPILFPTAAATELGKKNELSVKQQMELPEGSYIIENDNKVITLPEPSPLYQTKKSEYIVESLRTDKDLMNFQEIKEEVTSYIAAAKEKQAVSQSGISEHMTVPKPQYETNDLGQIEAQLIEVKAMLEKEKLEKQALLAKLEYSNELLVQLYKSK